MAFADPNNQPRKTHFLGAVVLNVNRIVGRSMPRSDVIDGQQRLTTLQIFLAALRDYAANRSDDTEEAFARLTRNPVRDETSEERQKVWPTNSDRATFVIVMTCGSPTALRTAFASGTNTSAALPRMAEAYLFFYDAIRGYVEPSAGNEDCNDRMHSIAQALRTALQFVVIELEESDDPQVIFETLNARGQPLLPSDLIRNYVFLKASATTGMDADRLYNTYWRPFDDLKTSIPDESGEDRFWHASERQGRLIRPRIDLFMFHYLVMKTETDLNIGRLFYEFREWRDGQASTIEEFLAELKSFSALFRQLISPDGNGRLARLAQRLKSLDTSTVYPVLLFLACLSQERLPPAHFDRCLVDLESWLIRRFICQLTNKNYNRFFLSMLIKLKRAAESGESVADTLREELSRSSDTTVVWPTDDEFKRAWRSKPIYVKSRIDRCAMILRALEEQYRTSRNENVTLPAELTVEHLLPQKGSVENYPYADPMPLEPDETADKARERIINTVGNLTLLTQALNSSASNGPFPDKRSKIIVDSDLRLNAWLRTDERSNWSERDIHERADELFRKATAIWPKNSTAN